jgi:hypothetical protein
VIYGIGVQLLGSDDLDLGACAEKALVAVRIALQAGARNTLVVNMFNHQKTVMLVVRSCYPVDVRLKIGGRDGARLA